MPFQGIAEIEPYLRAWALQIELECRVALSFEQVDLIEVPDLESHPLRYGPEVRGEVTLVDVGQPKLLSGLPVPTTEFAETLPLVALQERVKSYREGRESLAAFAYHALTTFEDASGAVNGRRKKAASRLHVCRRRCSTALAALRSLAARLAIRTT